MAAEQALCPQPRVDESTVPGTHNPWVAGSSPARPTRSEQALRVSEESPAIGSAAKIAANVSYQRPLAGTPDSMNTGGIMQTTILVRESDIIRVRAELRRERKRIVRSAPVAGGYQLTVAAR